MTSQPALFLSHGAPDLALADNAASRFLRGLGAQLHRPDAIVIVSAHHEGAGPLVRAPSRFRTWHDFGNFDRRLLDMRYEAVGAAALGEEVLRLLKGAGLAPAPDSSDLLDHGAWVPLSLILPAADIPLVAVSIDPKQNPAWHHRVGAALAALRSRNVLLIGSGSISHNLSEVFRPTGIDRAWVDRFTDWLESKVRAGDTQALLAVMSEAPEAFRNHPTDEHLLPFFFALGAGGQDSCGRRIHHSLTYRTLAMDAYAFGAPEQIEALRSGPPVTASAG